MNYIKNRFNKNLLFLLLTDSAIIISSLYLSVLFRFDFKIPFEIKEVLTFQNFLVLIILKIFCFRMFALYRGMWRYTSVWDMINIVKANILSTIFLVLLVFSSIGFSSLSRSLFVIDFIVCTGMVSISRLGIRMFFSHISSILSLNNPNNIEKKVLLIGAGDTGQIILRQTLQNSNSNISVVGFLDDDGNKIGRRLHGVPIISRVDSISALTIDFDEVYICVPSANRNKCVL